MFVLLKAPNIPKNPLNTTIFIEKNEIKADYIVKK